MEEIIEIEKRIKLANELKESGNERVIKIADDLISSCNKQLKILTKLKQASSKDVPRS